MSKKKVGGSHSIRPVSKRPPAWCRYQPEEVEALIIKFGKEGRSPSNIGMILRDQYGIPLVKSIIGKSVSKVLRETGLLSSIPEDLGTLLRKARRLHVHLEKNTGDLHNKRQLQLVEAQIRKISKYYVRKGFLPIDWKYDAKTAALL